jgi:hypothetical protein
MHGLALPSRPDRRCRADDDKRPGTFLQRFARASAPSITTEPARLQITGEVVVHHVLVSALGRNLT